jgi:hypothetical protein
MRKIIGSLLAVPMPLAIGFASANAGTIGSLTGCALFAGSLVAGLTILCKE